MQSSHPTPWELTHPHQSAHPPLQDDEDIKAPYDDLIDQYAVPFGKNSQHKAYTVDSSAFDGGATSYSLDHKPTHMNDPIGKDLEGSTAHGHDWEYPPTSQKEERERQRNWFAGLIPDSLACRLYLLVVLIETSIDLAIEADLLIRFHELDKTQSANKDIVERKMPVYLTIFAFAHVFQFVLAVDAVAARNTLQFIFLAVFNAVFLVYAIIQINEIRTSLPQGTTGLSHIPIDVLTTIIPIVISVAELVYCALGWKIYKEFGWKVYKFLGADRRIRTMYTWYQIYLCLIKFDLFFWVGFSIQFIWLVLNNNDAEYYLTCAALPLSVIVLVEGHLAARYENEMMMWSFMAGCVAALVYFVYKLVKVVRFKATDPTISAVWETLTTFSVIAILLLLATFIIGCIVMHNFGRGLKRQISKNQGAGVQRGKSLYVHRGPMATHPNRISIE
ncbi:hypothetical protein BC835DRAFT_1280513 [Cytidiella melzeri]|nr:hypothetical protein BC835DRAFT_1280513 [Cytidiella melzeri]